MLLPAIGIVDCRIAVLRANGDLVNLVLHGVLYVPEARRNLLSASQLAKDRFQVVLPANDSAFCPGIYNCRKNKTSVEHFIPIVAVGSLFHIHTCADAEVRPHDRQDNLYIVWHRRLGYMPLETIRMMIDSCQGLDDLRGVPMPRNYVSANVRRGKSTSMDLPKSNPHQSDQPLQVVHFDLFGPCKWPSFAGHS